MLLDSRAQGRRAFKVKVARENTGCPVKFEFHTNEFFFLTINNVILLIVKVYNIMIRNCLI